MDENKIEQGIEENTEDKQPDIEEIRKFRKDIIGVLIIIVFITFIVCAMTVPVIMAKPAIYLYPETVQKIEIKLDKTIKYSNVIPKYDKKTGWRVEAEPNGNVRD